MARSTFGGTTADTVAQRVRILGHDVDDYTAATLTVWSAQTGGTQYTDLLVNGAASSSVPVDATGQVPEFQGPDGVTIVWVSAGGARVKMLPAEGPTDTSVAGYVNDSASSTRAALDGRYAPTARRFVVFGDSWAASVIDGVNIPTATIGALGGTIVANYSVAGSQIAPDNYTGGGTWNPANTTGAQADTAAADTSYNKNRITDVLVLAGVNNIGGYLPTVVEARDIFAGMGNLYPNARLWYAANSKKSITNSSDNDPWRWYSRFFAGASLAGFAVADFSPMWNWGENQSTYWPVGSVDTDRHMAAAGQTAWAKRLKGFLAGSDGWRPFFKVAMALHPDAVALVPGATIYLDDSYIDGGTLHLRVLITGMDSLTTAPDTNLLQIPTAYGPKGNWNYYPAAAYISSQFNWSYTMEVVPGGVVVAHAPLLNDHQSFFLLSSAIPLTQCFNT